MMGLVWPFQLAWPAVAFSISKREGHERSYARVLTYLTFALVMGILGLSLLSRAGLGYGAGSAQSKSSANPAAARALPLRPSA